MARLDFKKGKFTADSELNEIHEGLRGYQTGYGDQIDYYRFMPDASFMHDIYDEGADGGRAYNGPIVLPVLDVVHEEAGNEDGDTGFYFNDDLHVTMSYNTFVRAGLPHPDQGTADYLRDRIIYDSKVFRVMKISVLGQIQRRDVIISIEATQVRGDELVNDSGWEKYSQPI